MQLEPVTDPEQVSLQTLARKIRRSSNFRFDWQWLRRQPTQGSQATEARRVLDQLIRLPACHRFLAESFDPMYDSEFSIGELHRHATMVSAGEAFEETLARAAADRLGAYSRDRRPARPREKRRIERLFSAAGPYSAYELRPGSVPDCQACADSQSHLYTNWFFGVFWDWCFVLLYPDGLTWVGCLTDTD